MNGLFQAGVYVISAVAILPVLTLAHPDLNDQEMQCMKTLAESKAGWAGLDTWRGFAVECETIFRFIKERNISGVVLLSGDRHRSDAWQILHEDGYDLFAFGSCHLKNIHTHPLIEQALFGYNEKNSLGLLMFDTTARDPSVIYWIIDRDGQTKGELKLLLSQLSHNNQ